MRHGCHVRASKAAEAGMQEHKQMPKESRAPARTDWPPSGLNSPSGHGETSSGVARAISSMHDASSSAAVTRASRAMLEAGWRRSNQGVAGVSRREGGHRAAARGVAAAGCRACGGAGGGAKATAACMQPRLTCGIAAGGAREWRAPVRGMAC